MPSTHTPPFLRVRTSSRAMQLQRLGQDIQDAVIDLWHHPHVAQATLRTTHPSVLLHVQVLIDLPMLKLKPQSDIHAGLCALFTWLKTHRVTYEVGYLPLPAPTLRAAQGKPLRTHQLVLSAMLPSPVQA